jgi:glycosyltransferase involved in cell wall biosynthesis
MRLSACMIVKNEAPRVGASLESLRGHVDEVVVVDNGSTDDTVQIARSAGARVAFDDGDLSAARNCALREARGHHRLMIDADEVVRPDSWGALRAFMGEGKHRLGRILVVSDTAEGVASLWLTRVCTDDPRHHYEGAIHEQLVGPGPVGNTGLVVLHSGYTPEAMARKGTVARNLKLLRGELERRPDDAYLHYQLGRTLLCARRPAEAAACLRAAVQLLPPNVAYAAETGRDLGYALRQLSKPDEALAVARRFQAIFADYTDLFFLEGLCHMDLGNATEMLRAFARCLDLGEAPHYATVEGVGSYRAHYNLGLFHELARDMKTARFHYERAVAPGRSFLAAAERLARLPASDPAPAHRNGGAGGGS